MAQLRAKQIKLAAAGDILVGGTNGNGTVLTKGTDGQILKVVAGGLAYANNTAGDIAFTPTGDIAATTVQAAIAEVATDAAAAQATATTATNNLQTELDNTQAGAGLSTTGAYVAETTSNYINGATSLKGADMLLDAALKAVDTAYKAADADLDERVTDLETAVGGNITDLQEEVDAIETAVGLNADGTFTAISGSTHAGVNGAASVKAAIVAVDAALAAEETARADADAALDGRLDTVEADVTTAKADIDALESDLADEVTARTDADAAIQTELNELENTVGSTATGGKVAFSTTNYVSNGNGDDIAQDSHNVAIGKLDAALKAEEVARQGDTTSLTTLITNEKNRAEAAEADLDERIDALELGAAADVAALEAEVDRVEAALGLNTDGTRIDYTSVNYIEITDTFKAAIEKLDTALKAEETARETEDTNIQQQLNSLVGLDALVFKGNVAGDITQAALEAMEATAEEGDVYRVSSNPSATFADQGYDVNIGDFVAYVAPGVWAKFDNTDPTLESGDANILVTGNTFTGYELNLDKKTASSVSDAIVITGGTNAVLSTMTVDFDASQVNFSDLAQTGTPEDGKFLKWDATNNQLVYVTAAQLGATVHSEEDFAPSTAANAVVTLAHTPVTGSVAVYINGVKLKKSGYAVSGTSVTLNDTNNGYGVETGDTVAVSYDYAA